MDNLRSATTTEARDVYWHIYRREQIKPALRGNLVLVLEIPGEAGAPVLRHVVDRFGRDFPEAEKTVNELLSRLTHGVVFCGVNKAA